MPASCCVCGQARPGQPSKEATANFKALAAEHSLIGLPSARQVHRSCYRDVYSAAGADKENQSAQDNTAAAAAPAAAKAAARAAAAAPAAAPAPASSSQQRAAQRTREDAQLHSCKPHASRTRKELADTAKAAKRALDLSDKRDSCKADNLGRQSAELLDIKRQAS